MQTGIEDLVVEYASLWIVLIMFANLEVRQLWAHMHKKARKTMARRRYSVIAVVLTVVVLVWATIVPVGVIAVFHPGLATGLVEYLTAWRLFWGAFLLYVLFMMAAG